METSHKILLSDSRNMSMVEDNSVDLTVTSPPYPMIEMWDDLFSGMNEDISSAISDAQGHVAFELMHLELDRVWEEVYRVTKEGGWVAINIGDATRKIGDCFQLYPNHTRITSKLITLGFSVLPIILWRKTTNSPNKFMGSGMLPSGAYVTLEHEYILLFRKGQRRRFVTAQEKENRKASAFFWEERNTWFSDTWDLKGIAQNLSNGETRERSAAYPLELASRLIHMYSCKQDLVLDPFLGTGTTSLSAAIGERNSIGFELDKNFKKIIFEKANRLPQESYRLMEERIDDHISFIHRYLEKRGGTKHLNIWYDFPVVTSQEKKMVFSYVDGVEVNTDGFIAKHKRYKRENHPIIPPEKEVKQISLCETR